MDWDALAHGANSETPTRKWIRAWAATYVVYAFVYWSMITVFPAVRFLELFLVSGAVSLLPFAFSYVDVESLRRAGVSFGDWRFLYYLAPAPGIVGLLVYAPTLSSPVLGYGGWFRYAVPLGSWRVLHFLAPVVGIAGLVAYRSQRDARLANQLDLELGPMERP